MPWRRWVRGLASHCEPCTWITGCSRARPMRRSAAALHACDSESPSGSSSSGLNRSRGESLEAAAREARYAALERQLAPGEWLLTAHHRDDQLETVLIQLLRGAGVAGMAAMPARTRRGQGWHARPLLEVDRAELAAYAARAGLSWQQDPMNDETRFDRAWLRTRVLPAIRERWPAAATTVARSAGHFAEASSLLAEMAAADAAGVLDDGRLLLEGLGCLSPERRVNLLRWWLRRQGLRPPPAARLAAAMPAFFAARRDAAPCLRWDDGEVRRYRGRLYALAPLPGPPQALNMNERSLDLGRGLGRFELVPGTEGGLADPLPAAVALRFRAGGESLRPHHNRPRKRLKDLCQETGIVPWMRDRLPLVYVGDQLAAVGDLWVDADFAASAGSSAAQAGLDRAGRGSSSEALRLSASIRRCCRSRPSRTPCVPRGQSPRISGTRCPAPGSHPQSPPP